MPKWKPGGVSSRPQSDAVLAISINHSGTLIAAGHFDGTVVGYDASTLAVKLIFNVSRERNGSSGTSSSSSSAGLVPSLTGKGKHSAAVVGKLNEDLLMMSMSSATGSPSSPSKAAKKSPPPTAGSGTKPTTEASSSVSSAFAAMDFDAAISNKHPITALCFRPASATAAKKGASATTTTPSSSEDTLLVTTTDGIVERRVIGNKIGGGSGSKTGPAASLTMTTVSVTGFREVSSEGVIPSATNNNDTTDGNDGDETSAKNNAIPPTYNEVYAAAYRDDGKLFATGGLDACVRIYDDASLQLLHILRANYRPSSSASSATSLRLQAVRFSHANSNVVMAGGWGQVIHFWDIAATSTTTDGGAVVTTPTATSSTKDNKYNHVEVFGPYAIGQGIDAREGEVVAVSFRGQHRLQTMPEPKDLAAFATALHDKAAAAAALGKRASFVGGFPMPLTSNKTAAGGGSNVGSAKTSATGTPTGTDGATNTSNDGLSLKSLNWPSSKLNFFPACVAISPKASDGEHFIALGGGGGQGLTEAGMLLSGSTKEVVGEFLAVGCVNCCSFGTTGGGGGANGSLIVAFGDSKGNVQVAKYVK